MEKFKMIIAIILGVTATFLKQYGMIILLVGCAVAIDFITGLIKAKVTGEQWSSKKGFHGFWKKIGLFMSLFFCIFLDFFIPLFLQLGLELEFKFSLPFGLISGMYIIVNEGISICENLYLCNENALPKCISNLLQVAKNKMNEQ